jgi:hypothetical protein
MKRCSEMRADSRDIVEKAFGLIYAMSDDDAARLKAKLQEMARADSKRAQYILGVKK